MNEFEEKLLRLKQALGETQDRLVAEALGLSKAAFSERKSNGSFPDKHVFALAAKRPELHLDALFVLTGKRAGPLQPPLDAAKFTDAVVAIDAAIAARGAALEPERRARLYLGLYEASIETGAVSARAADMWVKLALEARQPGEGSASVLNTFHGAVGNVHAVHQGSMHNTYEKAAPASKPRPVVKKRHP